MNCRLREKARSRSVVAKLIPSMKAAVAEILAKRVKDRETIGLGSGTTAELAVELIGKRIRAEGLQISGVPTSHGISLKAAQAGIAVLSPLGDYSLDWSFDGADEVDGDLNMIKGQGGAMLLEKVVARQSKSVVIIVTEEKLVKCLGERHRVPVEVVPEAVHLVTRQLLDELGAESVELRMASKKYGPVISEHNNLILDVKFSNIDRDLEQRIKVITGVVESGLFIDCASEVLVATPNGVISKRRQGEKIIEAPV